MTSLFCTPFPGLEAEISEKPGTVALNDSITFYRNSEKMITCTTDILPFFSCLLITGF